MRDSALKLRLPARCRSAARQVGEELMRDSALKLVEPLLFEMAILVGEELMRDSALKPS